MTDREMMELAKQMGWKTWGDRWWTKDFDPAQNTWTWDRVKEYIFGKPPL